jgi:hypothetical protein
VKIVHRRAAARLGETDEHEYDYAYDYGLRGRRSRCVGNITPVYNCVHAAISK